jgi:hypothetical protein
MAMLLGIVPRYISDEEMEKDEEELATGKHART